MHNFNNNQKKILIMCQWTHVFHTHRFFLYKNITHSFIVPNIATKKVNFVFSQVDTDYSTAHLPNNKKDK